VEDTAQKRERRKLDKFITLNVQQISGTQQQVTAKARALTGFLRSLEGAPRAYAMLQLAGRIISQCECQVALNHTFAFPLAQVSASVAAAHPDFVPILLAKLHHVRSPCLVPGWPGCRHQDMPLLSQCIMEQVLWVIARIDCHCCLPPGSCPWTLLVSGFYGKLPVVECVCRQAF
jgi:hypothetical protein